MFYIELMAFCLFALAFGAIVSTGGGVLMVIVDKIKVKRKWQMGWLLA